MVWQVSSSDGAFNHGLRLEGSGVLNNPSNVRKCQPSQYIKSFLTEISAWWLSNYCPNRHRRRIIWYNGSWVLCLGVAIRWRNWLIRIKPILISEGMGRLVTAINFNMLNHVRVCGHKTRHARPTPVSFTCLLSSFSLLFAETHDKWTWIIWKIQ